MQDDPQTNSGKDERTEQDDEPKEASSAVPATVDPQLEPSVKTIGRQAGNGNSDEQDEAKRQKTLERATVWQAWCAIAIACFTLAQVVVGYWQWDATDKQYKSMNKQLDTMLLEQRPWLTTTMDETSIEGDSIRLCGFDIKNSGKTQATVTGFTFKHFVRNAEKIIDEEMSGSQGWNETLWRPFVVQPGDPAGQIVPGPKLTKQEIVRINNNSAVLYFGTRLTFADMHGKKTTVQRCFRYSPDPEFQPPNIVREYDRIYEGDQPNRVPNAPRRKGITR